MHMDAGCQLRTNCRLQVEGLSSLDFFVHSNSLQIFVVFLQLHPASGVFAVLQSGNLSKYLGTKALKSEGPLRRAEDSKMPSVSPFVWCIGRGSAPNRALRYIPVLQCSEHPSSWPCTSPDVVLVD